MCIAHRQNRQSPSSSICSPLSCVLASHVQQIIMCIAHRQTLHQECVAHYPVCIVSHQVCILHHLMCIAHRQTRSSPSSGSSLSCVYSVSCATNHHIAHRQTHYSP